ncbi:hypothetical protein, partial [Cetobacterium sp.]|uniref:hypothetical protein n=1 Tax=Cetobacterium sp. TaxID=2071632 RepID=UPI003EE7D29E
ISHSQIIFHGSAITVKMFVVVLMLVSLLRSLTSIRLDENGYTVILNVINPAAPENKDIINQTKVYIW